MNLLPELFYLISQNLSAPDAYSLSMTCKKSSLCKKRIQEDCEDILKLYAMKVPDKYYNFMEDFIKNAPVYAIKWYIINNPTFWEIVDNDDSGFRISVLDACIALEKPIYLLDWLYTQPNQKLTEQGFNDINNPEIFEWIDSTSYFWIDSEQEDDFQ